MRYSLLVVDLIVELYLLTLVSAKDCFSLRIRAGTSLLPPQRCKVTPHFAEELTDIEGAIGDVVLPALCYRLLRWRQLRVCFWIDLCSLMGEKRLSMLLIMA